MPTVRVMSRKHGRAAADRHALRGYMGVKQAAELSRQDRPAGESAGDQDHRFPVEDRRAYGRLRPRHR